MKKVFILTALISLTLFFACNKQEVEVDFVPANQEVTSFPSALTTAKADFSINISRDIFEKDILTFTNNSLNAESYHWDFGNGGTSSSEDPTYMYKMHGYYTITLTVTDAHGNIDQVTKDVPVLCIFGGGTHPSTDE